MKNGKYKKIPIGLDGVCTTAWHPKDNKIVFIGHKNDASDLYLIDLKTEKVTNLTNDIFSDFSPSWSLNGDKVFFSSDQSSYKDNTDISEIDFSKKDIFMYDFTTESITQITDTDHDEAYPVASKDNILFYTADYNLSLIHI